MNNRIPSVEDIDAILPQTQCTKCGYQGCRPYAEAMSQGDAINKCPPGGQQGIEKLASLLSQPVIPLDTTHGEELAVPLVAFIREAECIGCTKCIQACPVDAIVGAAKLMHTVVTDICTGCDLCVAPCPVDCIDMVPAPAFTYSDAMAQAVAEQEKANLSRTRFQKRNARLARMADEKLARREARAQFQSAAALKPTDSTQTRVQASVKAALAAVRQQAETQSPAAQYEKLERALASAHERFDRAVIKVAEAEKNKSTQLSRLRARQEDMRFKLDDAQRKLAAFNQAQGFDTALERMTFLRQQRTDNERIANGLTVIENKLAVLEEGLSHAVGDQRLSLETEIARLRDKKIEAEKSLRDLDNHSDT